MCEWNYSLDGSPKEGDDEDGMSNNLLYMLWRRLAWHLRPWRHGPDCKWMRWAYR